MHVKDVMTRDVAVVRPNAPLTEAAARMKELDVGPLPVCDGDRLVGMLTDRDITTRATAEGLDPQTARVQDAMTRDVVYCFEDQDVHEAAELMKTRQIRRLMVLNRDKRLVGIVSLGDLAVDVDDDTMAADVLTEVSEPAQPKR